jgi:hypothetical protein
LIKPTRALAQIVLVVIAISVTGLSAAAQESKIAEKDVPAAVIAAFKSAYPTATIKDYAREKENGKTFYEIESKDGDTGRDVLYNPDGSVAEIEETVAASGLPVGAQEVIRSKYPGAVVTKAEKTTEKTAQGDKVGYEVIAKQGKRRISLEFDADGKLKSKAK